jgi:hypothetical protein
MKPIISKNLTPLPYKGMGVLKPLPCKVRGLPEGSVYTLKTFQTSSKKAQKAIYCYLQKQGRNDKTA